MPGYMGAVKVVLSSLNEALDKLAGPNIGHMSDGLIGDASIFTTISWAFGAGTSTSFKLSFSSPSDEMWVNSCFDDRFFEKGDGGN